MKLVKYDAACRAIAEAKRVDDVKAYKDKAVAMQAYARQIKNPQLEADSWEIRKRAEDKLGALSLVLDKGRPIGRGKERPISGTFKVQALKAVGISKSAANRYEQFNQLSEREKERRIAKGRAAIEAGKSVADTVITQGDKKKRRDERERELGAKILALPTKQYGVILADPEWQFKPWSAETGMDRAADNHYSTNVTKVIASRDVSSIAAKDCALFLCATAPMLLDAMQVMDAWGFEYKTNWELHKDRVITGYWNRNRHEHLLLGIRRGGKVPAPAPGEQWESVIEAPVGKHSEKPEAIHEMIEAYFPNLPKIELNRRGKPRPDWDAWGLETESQEAAE